MTMEEAQAAIVGIISEDKWSSFTDWAEELQEEGGCEHEEDSYEPWLRDNGAVDPAGDSVKLYDAMGVFAGTGPCAAGQGLFGYPGAAKG